jgi:hypothetical protein
MLMASLVKESSLKTTLLSGILGIGWKEIIQE